MMMLILGLALWTLPHAGAVALPALRQSLIDRLGNGPYRGVFALTILAGLVLIVFGWRATEPAIVYIPPQWGHPVASLIILIGFLLMGAANGKTMIRSYLRHPQLTGTLLWAIGHLIVNGDIRSVLVFVTIGIWTIVMILLCNTRDGAWQKPEPATPAETIKNAVISVIVYIVFIVAHPYLFGVSPLPA